MAELHPPRLVDHPPAAGIQTETWLRRFRTTSTATIRLVCLPHAGGAATYYFPMSSSLPSWVDVLAVQYPGRQDRRGDRCIDSIGELADRVSEAVFEDAKLPTAFFGHSMGAVVAFEVARRLEARGAPPAVLFVSGRRAPSRTRPGWIHQLDNAGIIAELRRLSATDDKVLSDEEFMRAALPAIRNDYKAIETYACPGGTAVTSPITVLVGDRDPQTTIEEAEAWRRHTTGAFTLKTFPGGHFFLNDNRMKVAAEVINGLAAHM